MKKFDMLCEQLFKVNIPFSQNDGIISIQPDNANINIHMSIYVGVSYYGWYKRINNKIETGIDENFQNLLVRIMNFYVDYENTS